MPRGVELRLGGRADGENEERESSEPAHGAWKALCYI